MLIPSVYCILLLLDQGKKLEKGDPQLFCSVKSFRGGKLALFSGRDSLMAWSLKPGEVRFLQYRLDSVERDRVKFCYTPDLDRDSFLLYSLNAYDGEKVWSLNMQQLSLIKHTQHIQLQGFGSGLLIEGMKSALPQELDFSSPKLWSKSGLPVGYYVFTGMVMLAFFLLMVFKKPPDLILRVSVTVSVVLMILFFVLRRETQSLIITNLSKPVSQLEVFYNQFPAFAYNRRAVHEDSTSHFMTQVNPEKYPYVRIDIPPATGDLDHWEVILKAGFLTKKFSVTELPPGSLLVNDLDIGEGKEIRVRGEDPYWVLCSGPLIRQMESLLFLRKQLFLFIPLLFFGLLIFTGNFWSETPFPKLLLGMCFLAMSGMMLSLFPFNSRRIIMESENRLAAARPVLKISKLDVYIKDMKTFLNDQLPFRAGMVSYRNFMEYSIFGGIHRPVPMVHFGKDHWMFYTGENVKEIYQNRNPLTDAELKKICLQLERRRNWLRERGIHYYILFPHISNFVYEEKIGKQLLRDNPRSKLQQLLDYLKDNSDLAVVDVNQPMAEAKMKYRKPLYYTIDSHWNLFGSYFAYKAIIDAIRIDFPQLRPAIRLDSIHWTVATNYEGDLARLVSIDRFIKRIEYLPDHPFVNASTMYPPPLYTDYLSVQPMVLQLGNDQTMPRMLMNRDSYCNYLMPYLSGHFSRSLYLWSPLFFPGVIEKDKPDIVILEMLERFIYDLLIEDPPLPAGSPQ